MNNLDKNQKINVWVLGVLAFVGFPLFTAIFLALENPIMHSITEMGFDLGHYAIFLTWGIACIAYILYSLLMSLKESYYCKELKIVFIVVIVVVDVLFAITGTFSDNPNVVSDTIIQIHNKCAIAMFIAHFVLIGLMTIFSFFRNKTQGFVNLTFIGFLLISLVYCYAGVTLNESFALGQAATALCEGFSFVLIVIFMFINYAGNLFFAPTGKTKLIVKEKSGKII